MRSPLIHRWISALLAATYLVVGGTGDALYYLFESPQAEQAAGGGGHGVFLHDHGDGLWHHHGHAQRESASASKQPRFIEGLTDRDASSRHDHTTLLLAIASAIELSVLASLPFSEAPQAVLMVGLEDGGHAESSDRAGLGPRGPPGNGLA